MKSLHLPYNLVGKLIFLFILLAVFMQVLFQQQLHLFLLISVLWLSSSFVLILVLHKLTIDVSESVFCITLFIVTIIWGTFLIIISSTSLSFFRGMPFVGMDDVEYNIQQIDIANRLINRGKIEIDLLDSGFYAGYANFGGIIMYLVGIPHWSIPRIATVILFASSSVLFYTIMRSCYTLKASRIISFIFALSPMFIFYAVFQLKDSLIIFLLLIAFSSAFNISKGRSVVWNILLMISTLACLIPIRAMTIVSALLAITLYWIHITSGIKRLASLFLVISICMGIIYVWNYSSSFGTFMTPNDYYDVRFSLLGDSQRLTGENSVLANSSFAYIVSAPLFILLSPLVPIPTALLFVNPEYPNLNHDFSNNIFLYALLPFFLMSVIIWYNNRKEYRSVTLFIFFFLIYKIGTALSGMALWSFRQSLPATMALLMIIPISFENYQIRLGRKLTIFLLSFLYVAWSLFRLYIRS